MDKKPGFHIAAASRQTFRKLYQTARKTAQHTALGKRYFRYRQDTTYNVLFPSFYNVHQSEPVDDRKVLFLEVAQPALTNNLQLIYDHLKQDGTYTIHTHFLRTNFVSMQQWRKNCAAFLSDLATAKYLFLTEGSQVLSCVDLRKETVVVQTWHGCGAFKRFGFSTADRRFGQDRETQLRHPLNRNYTYVTVSSPEVVWAYVEAMQLQGHENIVRPIGVSRTDVFFDQCKIKTAYEDVYRKFPAARKKKIILYAPTFRGTTADAKAPDRLDVRAFYQAFGQDYVLIIKHHQLVRTLPELPAELTGSFVYDASRSLPIDELLMTADLCISDYSSLIFEYSLFERPMFFFSYDLEDYFDDRGFYYSYDEMTPGPVCRTNEELIRCILHSPEQFDQQRVHAFRQKFMNACDGHSTERIEQLVFGRSLRCMVGES